MKLWSIEGNSQRLDGGSMFGNAPRALWTRWAEPDDLNRIRLATRGLLATPLNGRTVLFEIGIGAFFDVNRLSLVAANASLQDTGYIASVRAKVAAERDTWHELFRTRKVRFTDSHGNFVFFDSGRPHQEIAAALAAQGIEVGRPYPSLPTWVRISIGLPEDNAIARQAVGDLLRPS